MARNRNRNRDDVFFPGDDDDGPRRRQPSSIGNNAKMLVASAGGIIFLAIATVIAGFVAYNYCRIDVPAKHIAVLTRKTGIDMENGQEIAASIEHKGIQKTVLNEGRYFRNPYHWDWAIYPMIEIPENKMGVRIRMYGKDLGYGDFVVSDDTDEGDLTQKGILRNVLRPGRYALNAVLKDEQGRFLSKRRKNDYVEMVELHDPVTIPAGFKGVVTNLSGPMPDNPNQFLVPKGSRGVQSETLDEGTYYLNPYQFRVQSIDCRSQRFNLAEGEDMGFPSKDGFWVSLDGIIEFRVKPQEAAKVYVMYDEANRDEGNVTTIDKEIIRKVIMPNARSFCRLRGSDSSGRDFINGETRSAFQAEFQEAIRTTCDAQGIEIVQALITRINPPKKIAEPISEREVAAQQLKQYQQEKLQQDQEAKLAKEKALVEQLKELVGADREVVKMTTEAGRRMDVALAEANRDKDVAVEELAAAKDEAAAILAEKRAEAAVIGFENEAAAAGWKAAVTALGGSGDSFARYVLYQKLAPGFKQIMTNTADSPLMRVFENFGSPKASND